MNDVYYDYNKWIRKGVMFRKEIINNWEEKRAKKKKDDQKKRGKRIFDQGNRSWEKTFHGNRCVNWYNVWNEMTMLVHNEHVLDWQSQLYQ